MKKIFRKNQIIVTALAVLIAVAGYLNYTNNDDNVKEVNNTYEQTYAGDDLLTKDYDIESLDEDIETESAKPGEAVFTNGNNMSNSIAKARIDREQLRSKNKETLLEVINNNDMSENQKKKAVKSMVEITENAEIENDIENLLRAKGFEDILVTINDNQVDVVVSESQVDDEQRAQIEDVIKRKTGIKVKGIVITPSSDK